MQLKMTAVLWVGIVWALPGPAVCQSTVTFDFDTGTPALTAGVSSLPFDQTSGAITAHFSSPSGPVFSIQSNATTGWTMSKFSGNYLYDNNNNVNVVDIKFNQPVISVTLAFATADFQQVEVPTTIQLAAYVDSTATPAVGLATAHGIYASDFLPMGILSVNAGGKPFNLVEISIPLQPRGAAAFFVDSIAVVPALALNTVSAASYTPGGPLAAEMIVTAYGQGLAAGAAVAPPDQPLPTSLDGTAVSVRDSAGIERPAPLWFVSPGQIMYYIPEGTAAGTATVTVSRQAQAVVSGQFQIGPVAPGLFTMNASGQGVAAAVAIWAQPDNPQNWQYVFALPCPSGGCVSAPLELRAPVESMYLELFGTGIRGLSSPAAVSATIGGVDAPVEYAGPVDGVTGLDQVNVAVPPSLAGRGEVDILLTVDGKTANPVKVNFK
jgi:uncharacterized protein (TIGR03437 family)